MLSDLVDACREAAVVIRISGVENRALQQVRDMDWEAVADLFYLGTVMPEATGGMERRKAPVGVSKRDNSPPPRRKRGDKRKLFIGEVVDLTGDLAGYHGQWPGLRDTGRGNLPGLRLSSP
ncbi:MAG: hypothetical protein R3231_00140 [bacterium]|nr:hypothetical protein [bacterium]